MDDIDTTDTDTSTGDGGAGHDGDWQSDSATDGGGWHDDHDTYSNVHTTDSSTDHDTWNTDTDTDTDDAGAHASTNHADTDTDTDTHPPGCPCCSGTGSYDQPSPHSAGSNSTDSPVQGDTAGSGHDHPDWSETLGAAAHDPNTAITPATSIDPSPTATSTPLVPLDPSPAPATIGTGSNPDIVTIGGGPPNPAFATLLDDHNAQTSADGALASLSSMPPSTAAVIGTMLSHQAAVNAAMTDSSLLPEGVSADVAPSSTTIDYLATDGASFGTSGDAANHNKFG